MAWPKGKPRPKTAGRKRGTPNKDRLPLQERAEALGIDPFEVLLLFAKGDQVGLGYGEPTVTVNNQGVKIRIVKISLDMRLKAAIEASQYLHAKRKAVEHTGKDGGPVQTEGNVTLTIRDYTSGARKP